MSVSIHPQYKSDHYLKNLDDLIEEACNLYERNTDCVLHDANSSKMRLLSNTILSQLSEYSNFTSEFKRIKRSINYHFMGYNVIENYLCEMNKSPEYNNLNNLINIINADIISFNHRKKITCECYFPLNISWNIGHDEMRQINIISKRFFKINNKIPPKWLYRFLGIPKMIDNYRTSMVFYGKDETRDWEYSTNNIINRKFDSFLGSLIFIKTVRRENFKFNVFDDYSIVKNPHNQTVIVHGPNHEILYPKLDRKYEIERRIDGYKKEHIFKTMNLNRLDYNNYVRLMKSIHLYDKKMQNLLMDIFHIYGDASIEKKLSSSFLKFWIIIERIIKNYNAVSDEEVFDILKKFLNRKYHPLLKTMIKKRNLFVHNYYYQDITEFDRNQAKGLADQLIITVLAPRINIKKASEFDFYIRNFYKNRNKLKLYHSTSKKLITIFSE